MKLERGTNIPASIVLDAIAFVRSHYPEDIFPPVYAQYEPSRDQLSAQMARLTCDNIKLEIRERLVEYDEMDAGDEKDIHSF